MNKIHFKWKYGWLAISMAVVFACSEDNDLAQMANKQEQLSGTRTAELKTKTIELDAIGMLETKLTAAMAGEDVSTLEKLIVSGPMAAADFSYLRNYLTGIKVLDMKDAVIKKSDNYYYTPGYGSIYLKDDTICHSMFYNMDKLKEVSLPSTTLYIDNNAFQSCDSLVSVVIPDGVKKMNMYTFYDCKLLEAVTLPSNLEEIESHVFSGCENLKSIVIPDKVKYIGQYAFRNCSSLVSVDISSTSDLDSIGSYAFRNTNLKGFTFPDKLRVIESYAFKDCDSLSTVTLSSSLEYIKDHVFENCYGLREVMIPAKVEYIGRNAFMNCRQLSSVTFSSPAELDSIANEAFRDTNLKSIIIPEKVKTIGDFAFYSCDSLVSISLSPKLEYIGSYAFSRCAFTTVTLPSSLKTLSGCAFEYCRTMTSIDIPSGVETIGGHTFYDCRGLKELTIPETVTSIEGGFANYANNIQAIYWKAPIDVPYNWGTEDSFIYVETDQAIAVDSCWNNVIVNGVAQSEVTIVSRNDEFICFKEFTAPKVKYIRGFYDDTVPGGSSGWQTIVLPFTPDSIYHESKGRVAPFNSDVEGAKPFWLRELTADGFVDVTTIESDKAYLIAMPNHSDYLEDYRLNGEIIFTAKNVTIGKTPDVLEASQGPNFDFHPTYKFVKKALYVYTLEQEGGTYDNMWYYKNFFARSRSDVYPFNAYVTSPGGGRSSRSTYDIDTRSKESRAKYSPNNTGIPQIGDM